MPSYNLNSDELVNLVYLILLLGFLVSGFLVRNNLKISDLAKQALLWILITLTIIVIYSFRYDFYNLKNRIIAELFPDRVVAIDDNHLSINISNDGHFYIYLKINRQPVRFMVDTGASDLVLSLSDARRLGINIKNLSFDRRYETANGTIFGASTYVQEIEVTSNLKFYDVPVSVNSANMDVSLLGMRFLKQFKKYEFYQDKLILTY